MGLRQLPESTLLFSDAQNTNSRCSSPNENLGVLYVRTDFLYTSISQGRYYFCPHLIKKQEKDNMPMLQSWYLTHEPEAWLQLLLFPCADPPPYLNPPPSSIATTPNPKEASRLNFLLRTGARLWLSEVCESEHWGHDYPRVTPGVLGHWAFCVRSCIQELRSSLTTKDCSSRKMVLI